MIKYRLVVQSRDHHPHGVYSGTTNNYALQAKQDEGRWVTLPTVQFSELTQDEQQEIAGQTLRNPV